MSSTHHLTTQPTPQRLDTDASPQLINIMVRETNEERHSIPMMPVEKQSSQMFKAPCLFQFSEDQSALKQRRQSDKQSDEVHMNSMSSGSEDGKHELESPTTIPREGFASQLGNHNMEPIMEAGETKLEIEQAEASKPASVIFTIF